MAKTLLRLGIIAGIFGLLALWTAVPEAQAAAILVTSAADTTGADGKCTLREAITNANNNASTFTDCAPGNGADTISFASNVTGMITLTSGLPQVTDSLTISGPGAGLLAISGSNTWQVLNIRLGVIASVSGLTIQNGRSSFGGGIFNAGTLGVNNAVFSTNRASICGGGIFNDSGGTLIVNNSTFSGNTAASAGGGIYNWGTATVDNSTISGNTANLAGGGIFNDTTLTVSNSTLMNNIALGDYGGGIASWLGDELTISNSTLMNNTGKYGGGIASRGVLTATQVLFSGNSATLSGAAVYSDAGGSVSTSCFVSNVDAVGVFDVYRAGGTLTADGNWWNAPTGPNTSGSETTNILGVSYLTSPPAGCGGGAAGGGGDLCTDGRLNCRFGDDYAILYNAQDEHGHPSLHAYCVDAAGNGVLSLIVTPHDLEGIPAMPAANTRVKSADPAACRTAVSFWVLTTGEYQVNIGPDYKGDLIRMIFNGLPPEGIYFKKCNVLTSWGQCGQ